MDSAIEIEKPSRLGILPRLPKAAGKGRRHFQKATILGKRKRSELVVATDRERIDVYNVEIPRRLSSYSIPPEQVFTCPPCSYVRGHTRHTYAAVIDGPRHAIIGFSEAQSNIPSTLELSESNIRHVRFDLEDSTDLIQSLQVVPVRESKESSEATHKILAISSSGSLMILPLGIETMNSKTTVTKLADLSDSFNYTIRHSAVATDDPTIGLFKHHFQISNSAPVLGLIISPQSKTPGSDDVAILLLLQLYTNGGPVATWHSTFQLISSPTPIPPVHKAAVNDKIQYYLDLSQGFLLRTSSNSLEKFDILRPVITDSASPGMTAAAMNTFQTLGQDLIMSSAGYDLTIFDLTYGSLQSTLRLQRQDLPPEAGRIHKRKGGSARVHIELVAVFPSHGLVIGVDGTSLLGFHVSGLGRNQSSKIKSGDALPLLRCIAKGNTSKGPRDGLKGYDFKGVVQPMVDSARAWAAEVDRLGSACDSANLESFCQSFLASLDKHYPVPKYAAIPAHRVPDSLVDLTIKKVFRLDQGSDSVDVDEEKSSIRFSNLPLSMFRWLLQSRELSIRRIERVICGQLPSSLSSSRWFSRSLVEADPTMELLLEVLHSSSLFDPEELLSSINLLVESLGYRDRSTFEIQQLQLDNKPLSEEDEIRLQLQQEAAIRDLDLAVSVLNSDVGVQGQALTVALVRLAAFDSLRITQAMQSTLSKGETVDIVHLLRVQIRNAGWLNAYSEGFGGDAPFQDDPIEQQSIVVMSKIIDCALRSVGLGISAFENIEEGTQDAMENLVLSLKAEISAILESVQGAAYLHGIIAQLDVLQLDARQVSAKSALLPMSLSEGNVSTRKRVLGGGTKRRRKDEIARLSHMKVPKYSIDRLDL